MSGKSHAKRKASATAPAPPAKKAGTAAAKSVSRPISLGPLALSRLALAGMLHAMTSLLPAAAINFKFKNNRTRSRLPPVTSP